MGLVLGPVVDRPRLLHRRSELGYTDRPARAMISEPEAVPADYQRQLTADAPRRAAARDREVWVASRDRIRVELALLARHRFGRDVSSDLRVLERLVDRLDQLIRPA
jgi:hypothetical protein